MAEEGSRAAKLALELAREPNRYLPTVQLGITLINTFVAVFGGEELVTRSPKTSPKFHSISFCVMRIRFRS